MGALMLRGIQPDAASRVPVDLARHMVRSLARHDATVRAFLLGANEERPIPQAELDANPELAALQDDADAAAWEDAA